MVSGHRRPGARVQSGVLGAALLSLLLALFLPAGLTSHYEQKSLTRLQRQSRSIQREFAAVLKEQNQKLRNAAGQPWPQTSNT